MRVGSPVDATNAMNLVTSVTSVQSRETHQNHMCFRLQVMGKWLLGSGASFHMTFDRDDFCTLQSVRDNLEVFVASNDCLPLRGTGSVNLILESGRTAIVNNVFFIPGFYYLGRRLQRVEQKFMKMRCAQFHLKVKTWETFDEALYSELSELYQVQQ
ncbi:hypothetical protein CCR75_001162 [Bremia lactucae]|uniref:Retrovirus-related Pol polyprotein from transposon TNT 1-94-like beta-barrel domain-containing protein n=1 Tax=Bremia lactucae TaxID=4779 RepID=A0A976IFT8_BRELC|nr:hypothetical protein CCR75_001162 [Bremia lactucae]